MLVVLSEDFRLLRYVRMMMMCWSLRLPIFVTPSVFDISCGFQNDHSLYWVVEYTNSAKYCEINPREVLTAVRRSQCAGRNDFHVVY